MGLCSGEAKDDSAEDIRKVAAMANADFIPMAQEAWGLEPSKMAEYPAIVERYGSLSAYQHRVDAAAFTLETTLVMGRRRSPSRRRGFPRKNACAPSTSRSCYLLPKLSDISAH
jgi:hypothetical protein